MSYSVKSNIESNWKGKGYIDAIQTDGNQFTKIFESLIQATGKVPEKRTWTLRSQIPCSPLGRVVTQLQEMPELQTEYAIN